MEELETPPQEASPEAAEAEAQSPVADEAEAQPPLSDEGEPQPAAFDEAEAQPAVAGEAEAQPAVAGEAEAQPAVAGETEAQPAVSMEDLLAPGPEGAPAPPSVPVEDTQLKAVLEAIVYVAEEPLTVAQMAAALQQPPERIQALLSQLVTEFDRPEHGVGIREIAGGFKMTTKAEHHEAVRNFVKSLKPLLKLSLPALETLAVIAYKQPVTAPEVMAIRGVQGASVLKTLLDRKLIAAAGRKNVIGKPILYETTREFLIQFGLKDLSELPSLKEFEEIRRMALSDAEPSERDSAPPRLPGMEEAPVPAPDVPGQEN